MTKILIALALLATMGFANAAEETKNEFECWPSDQFSDFMTDKGYRPLLTMTDKNNLPTGLWLGGKNIVITAQKPKSDKDEKDYTCFLTTTTNVTFNSDTIRSLSKALEKLEKNI
jgi:hypothetical protein